MKILITNDDGIDAPGILALAQSLDKAHDVTIVAPNEGRSAVGHGISLKEHLYVQEVVMPNMRNIGYSVTGTPADCVKLAVTTLLHEKPDMVFSGINRGGNMGTDVLYSGTVSAAIEGAFFGIPSVAISAYPYSKPDYNSAAILAPQLASYLASTKLPRGTVLNVNVPNIMPDKIKGVRFTKMGVCEYDESYTKLTDSQNQPYYQLHGAFKENAIHNKNVDVYWLLRGYITITPLHFDMSFTKALSQIKEWTFDF